MILFLLFTSIVYCQNLPEKVITAYKLLGVNDVKLLIRNFNPNLKKKEASSIRVSNYSKQRRVHYTLYRNLSPLSVATENDKIFSAYNADAEYAKHTANTKPKDQNKFKKQIIQKARYWIKSLRPGIISQLKLEKIIYESEINEWILSYHRHLKGYRIRTDMITFRVNNLGQIFSYVDHSTNREISDTSVAVSSKKAKTIAMSFARLRIQQEIKVRRLNPSAKFPDEPYQSMKVVYKDLAIVEKLGDIRNGMWMSNQNYLWKEDLRLAHEFAFSFKEDPAPLLITGTTTFYVYIDTKSGECLFIDGFDLL